MNFINVLKKIGHGAEVVGKDSLRVAGPALTVVASIDPALGPVAALVSGISHSVLANSSKQVSGADKKGFVLSTVESITPVFSELLFAKMGHTVTDTARFQQGLDMAIEGILDIYKSFGAIPATTKPAAETSQTATISVQVSPPVV
jgi:hypothetical protein